MAEQTFRSPGFFETEIDLSTRSTSQLGTPAGIIGTSNYGPAFVPVTIGSFTDFETRFGGLDPNKFGPYAVNEFLKRRNAVTFLRVLGAGKNETSADIANYSLGGVVKNAGFKVMPITTATSKDAKYRTMGNVQFIAAKHSIPANSDIGFPVYTDNDAFTNFREFDVKGSVTLRFENSPTAGKTITIIAADGTGVTFTVDNSTTNASLFSRGGSYNGADNLATSIAASALAGKLEVSDVTTVSVGVFHITLTQATAGTAGNTTVTSTLDYVKVGVDNTAATNGAFTGGVNGNAPAADTAHLIRAGLFTTTGSLFYILDDTDSITSRDAIATDLAAADGTTSHFKLALYCGTGADRDTGDGTFGTADGVNGMKIFTCSLNPNDSYYIGKVMNTNPDKFQEEKHLLYWDFMVENELATVGTAAGSIALVSGSQAAVSNAGATVTNGFLELFGRFDTRYTAPKTTKFISQPFGSTEFDLFHFECLSDGAYANDQFKISIADVRASTDPNVEYGTFEVQIRRFGDNDLAPQILERFPTLSLDPNNERYIAKVIGDYKVSFNFDEVDDDERRLVVSGKYPNKSSFIRVVMSAAVVRGEAPDAALPFGFRGIPALHTNEDRVNPTGAVVTNPARLWCTDNFNNDSSCTSLTSSIVPPLPYRFKVTKGAVHSSPSFIGEPGIKERTDPRFYWGVKTDRLPNKTDAVLNANAGSEVNELVRTYTKFQGIQKLDALTADGAQSDNFHNHKFTLARVALKQVLDANGHIDTNGSLTGSSKLHMKDAAYIRNGAVNPKTYTVRDVVSSTDRITMASLVNSSSLLFNRFTTYTKFTNIFHGGFDGLNILDRDCARMNDRGASTETGGKAGDSIALGIGLDGGDNGTLMGSGKSNNIVASYRAAAEIMTDPMTVRTNILAIPGIRDSYVTDYAADKNKDYSMSIYLMDIPSYDESGNRLFDNSSARPAVVKTSEEFTRRVVDNNYTATYFPDVFIEDEQNGGRNVKVPSSIAALGALAFTDSVAYPWFAPAGFNRGAMNFVTNVATRLTTGDRDELYDARINPIATFPGGSFVIFGQKTLQVAKSALDRVNVRRMMLELKRQVITVADRLLFEQNNQTTRDRFVSLVAPKLALIQAQQGIESFRIVMDDTNNTELDKENNRLNGKIIVVPTRSIEFISIDFIITNAGVSFE